MNDLAEVDLVPLLAEVARRYPVAYLPAAALTHLAYPALSLGVCLAMVAEVESRKAAGMQPHVVRPEGIYRGGGEGRALQLRPTPRRA